MRRALSRLGHFHTVEPEAPQKPVVAVDGSHQTVGTAYPYFLTLIQAVALHISSQRRSIVEHRIFTPLFPEERAEIEGRVSEQQTAEAAAGNRIRELMAETELAAACKAAAEYEGALTLLDGGFVHFGARAGILFRELMDRAQANGGLAVGVIEEVSSRSLSNAVSGLWEGADLPYDREILYGLLQVGEVFVLSSAVRKDPAVGTVFARFAGHPQPAAFDYPADREEDMLKVLGALRALTPSDGRGIPAPIDIADRYVRLTAAEVEQLVSAAVPAAAREVLLTAHRLRRSI